MEVVVENRGSARYAYGHARNYADVAILKNEVSAGDLVTCRVERADADFLFCKLVEKLT